MATVFEWVSGEIIKGRLIEIHCYQAVEKRENPFIEHQRKRE